ncbi:tyrosine-protein phosphatase [Novosphingobium malaysiense]|uniref:Tyrosine specific protein phosphatases domain-containing protein n=1 Tax=Novosphingobium malaysiense TaxID=1348853 RepID=A0A0B1ZIY0_9SPHN|nr:tyrosine-protein phosphatase [Novosphingobium malaysiense]KHK89106.1 hypothetical protein LK12_22540 [Novosphingobium malaysiense]
MLRTIPNFRDVADVVPGLRRGRLFRSDFVLDPHEDDAKLVIACGLRWVVDLRSPSERQDNPNRFFERTGTPLVHMDVASRGDPEVLARALRSGDGAAGAHALMLEVYEQFPAGALAVVDALSGLIAQGDLPIMIHCAAGKDRTGFVVAALLRAIGIEHELVEADYLASLGRVHERTFAHSREIMSEMLDTPIDEAALAGISGVHSDFLCAAIRSAERRYGSFQAYLQTAGIDRERAQAMRMNLLEG